MEGYTLRAQRVSWCCDLEIKFHVIRRSTCRVVASGASYVVQCSEQTAYARHKTCIFVQYVGVFPMNCTVVLKNNVLPRISERLAFVNR